MPPLATVTAFIATLTKTTKITLALGSYIGYRALIYPSYLKMLSSALSQRLQSALVKESNDTLQQVLRSVASTVQLP